MVAIPTLGLGFDDIGRLGEMASISLAGIDVDSPLTA